MDCFLRSFCGDGSGRGGRRAGEEDFLLSVSGVGPHKNQTGLVEGFLRYRQHHPDSNLKLVLTGPVRRYEVIREILRSIRMRKNTLFSRDL